MINIGLHLTALVTWLGMVFNGKLAIAIAVGLALTGFSLWVSRFASFEDEPDPGISAGGASIDLGEGLDV
jgi:hypothetical protein